MGRPVLSPKLSRGTFSPTSEYSSQAGLHTQGEPGAAHWLSPEVSVTPPMAHGTAASSLPRRRLCAVLLAGPLRLHSKASCFTLSLSVCPRLRPESGFLSLGVETGHLGPGPGPAPLRWPRRAPCAGPRSLLPRLPPPPPSRRLQPHAGRPRQRPGFGLVQAPPTRAAPHASSLGWGFGLTQPSCPFKSREGCG